MKKQIRRISNFVWCFMACGLIGGVFCPPQTHAQQRELLATIADTWNLDYTVTLKGEGKEEPEIGSDGPVITWKVDRTYSGNVILDNSMFRKWIEENPHLYYRYMLDDEKLKRINEKKGTVIFGGFPKLHVQIKDTVKKQFDPLCQSYQVEVETWFMDENRTEKEFLDSITFNDWAANYDVNIGLIPVETTTKHTLGQLVLLDLPINYQKEITYYPKNEVKRTLEVRPAGKNLRISDINDYLVGERIIRSKKPLMLENGGFFDDSGEITVSKSVLDGVDTSGKVKIQITYKFQRINRQKP